jgi:hypothetical protein
MQTNTKKKKARVRRAKRGEEWINLMLRKDIERSVQLMQSQFTPHDQIKQIRMNNLIRSIL